MVPLDASLVRVRDSGRGRGRAVVSDQVDEDSGLFPIELRLRAFALVGLRGPGDRERDPIRTRIAAGRGWAQKRSTWAGRRS